MPMTEALLVSEETSKFREDVLAGLALEQKWIPAKYFYDGRGSELFEAICTVPEYYPFRAESEILDSSAEEIARAIGANALVIEPGSGMSKKVRPILRALQRPAGYVAVEISGEILEAARKELRAEFPQLPISTLCADYSDGIHLPPEMRLLGQRRVVFYPGSTVGNFHPDEAVAFLRLLHRLAGPGGAVLVGADLKKDRATLERAYDDAQGVTAAFNLNLLDRMNRELAGNFRVENFRHRAVYNESKGRVEMHLVSRVPQLVTVAGQTFAFREGETIHTENSYKYTTDEFTALASRARLGLRKFWLDSESRFALYYFVANL